MKYFLTMFEASHEFVLLYLFTTTIIEPQNIKNGLRVLLLFILRYIRSLQ